MKKFDHLFLMGRPASGKSEFIDFMKKISDQERLNDFFIGKFVEVDDFPWIWQKIVEDDEWEMAGYPRLYTFNDNDGNPGIAANAGKIYDLTLAKINHLVKEKYISTPSFYDYGTLIIEFARGMNNGYEYSFKRIDKELWEKAAILYVEVDGEESWRRNVARYEAKLKHSILAHMTPRKTFEAFYLHDDWHKITSEKRDGYLKIHGIDVPFVTMNNCPESTNPKVLGPRYGAALKTLVEKL